MHIIIMFLLMISVAGQGTVHATPLNGPKMTAGWRVPGNVDLPYHEFTQTDTTLAELVCQGIEDSDWHFKEFRSSRFDNISPVVHIDTNISRVFEKTVRCVNSDGNVSDTISIEAGLYCPGGNTLVSHLVGSTWIIDGCPLIDPDKDKNCPVTNPIYPGTGNKISPEIDINVTGRIEFKRVYNSRRAETSGAFGGDWKGTWTHNYDKRLAAPLPSEISTVYLHRPNGDLYYFNVDSSQQITSFSVWGELTQLPAGDWQFITLDDLTEHYDASGRLLSTTEISGNSQTLTYDTQNRLDRVETNTGEYLQFSYDASDRISTITDQASRTWTYRYDANNNLEFVDNPDTVATRQFHYNEPAFTSNTDLPHALTGITDARGIRYATYEYYADGRVKASYHAGNAQRVDIINYNDTSGTRTLVNSVGQQSTYTTNVQFGTSLVTDISGPGCSTCGTGNTSFSYDPANNNLLSKTENGVTTRHGNYDTKGQPGYRIDAAGTPEQRQTDYTYDSRFHNKTTVVTTPSVYTP